MDIAPRQRREAASDQVNWFGIVRSLIRISLTKLAARVMIIQLGCNRWEPEQPYFYAEKTVVAQHAFLQ